MQLNIKFSSYRWLTMTRAKNYGKSDNRCDCNWTRDF